jgi:hypothetical protein
MATIKTTPVIAASTASALEVTTVTEVITRLAAWLRRLPPPQERIDRLLAALEERFAGRTERITQDACAEIERVAWPYSRHLLLQYDGMASANLTRKIQAGPNRIQRPSCPAPPRSGRYRGWTGVRASSESTVSSHCPSPSRTSMQHSH